MITLHEIPLEAPARPRFPPYWEQGLAEYLRYWGDTVRLRLYVRENIVTRAWYSFTDVWSQFPPDNIPGWAAQWVSWL